MNRAAQPGGWKIADYYNQVQRTRRVAKTPGLGYRIRTYHTSAYFPSLAGHATPLPIGRAKILGISILLIGLVVGGFLLYQTSAFHSYKQCAQTNPGAPCQDPIQVIWDNSGTTGSAGNIPGFNSYTSGAVVDWNAGCLNTIPCIRMTLSLTTTGVALTKTTIGDLNPASKNLLGIYLITQPNFQHARDVGTDFTGTWGYYLTINGTVPTHNIGSATAYDPLEDPSVALVVYMKCNSGCSSGTTVLGEVASFQRKSGETIASEQSGECLGAGSTYLCQTQSKPYATYQSVYSTLLLNYTGVPNSNGCSIPTPGVIRGAGCSWLLNENVTDNAGSGFWASTQNLPYFTLTGQYYLGLFQMPDSHATDGTCCDYTDFLFDTGINTPTASMTVFLFTPSTTGPLLDTGGFFGPVIRWLINGGVFILANIFTFFSFVWSAIVVGLNAFGGFVGLGAIGTAITNAFLGFTTWITQVIGTVFNNVANIATSVGSAISAVGQLTTNFFNSTFGLGAWLTQLGNMASQFWGVMTTLGLYGKVGISFLLAAWMLWGAVLAYQDIDKFWNQWYRTTGFAFLWIFKVLWWSGEAAYGIMLKIKSLIWPTGSGGGIVQAPA